MNKNYITNNNNNNNNNTDDNKNNIDDKKMGQSQSCSNYLNPQITSRRRSFRSPFLRRKKHKHPLSATFQAPCSSNFEALNINLATAEQFMTLPGINRKIAQNIVEHRNAIGGRFQRIDDIALVSGIGAEKLEQIRPEICIKKQNRSVPGSSLSSRTPSLDSIFSEPNLNTQKVILNVNTSSVFQLQQIHGMNQEIAANLVDYRNRKGKFKSLDDLVKVKGLSQVRLGAIKSSLCVNDDDIPKTPKFSHSSTPMYPTSTPIKNGYNYIGHRKSMSVPIKMNLNSNGFSNAPVNDIFDLLGAYSHRPVVEESYNYSRNGHNTMRIASWNLDKMTTEKSLNLGVKEVICRTILENKFTIICVQEIIEPLTLQNICEELNSPTLRRVNEWKENSRNWKFLTNCTCKDGLINGLGFIYDNDRCQMNVEESFDMLLEDCKTTNYISPCAYMVSVKLCDWTCYLLNLYLRYFEMEKIKTIIHSIDERLKNRPNFHGGGGDNKFNISDIFLVVGDFSGLNYESLMDIQKFTYTKKINSNIKSKSKSKQKSVSSEATLSSIASTITINLENLGFNQIFESNVTSFSKEQPLNRSDIVSNCNILCREKMPILRSAFREALYKTNSPLTIYNNHNGSSNEKDRIPVKGDLLCGYYGIVRQGLCHMAIPRGWSWGGPASEHCPIWIEIYNRKERQSSNNVTSNTNHITKSNTNITTAPATVTMTRHNASLSRLNSLGDDYHKTLTIHNNNKRLSRNNSLGSNGLITKMNGYSIKNCDLDISSDSVFVHNDK